jgi:hypothetical protein
VAFLFSRCICHRFVTTSGSGKRNHSGSDGRLVTGANSRPRTPILRHILCFWYFTTQPYVGLAMVKGKEVYGFEQLVIFHERTVPPVDRLLSRPVPHDLFRNPIRYSAACCISSPRMTKVSEPWSGIQAHYTASFSPRILQAFLTRRSHPVPISDHKEVSVHHDA